MNIFNNNVKNYKKIARELSSSFYSKVDTLKCPNSKKIDALGCAIGDMFESLIVIYKDIVPSFINKDNLDKNNLHSTLMDLYSEFNHIDLHIKDAEEALIKLSNFLADED